MSEGFPHDALGDDFSVPGSGDGSSVTVDDGSLAVEPAVTLVDVNGDGIVDVIAVDDSGDGTADFAFVDNTGDGLVDVVVVPGETLAIDNSSLVADPDDMVPEGADVDDPLSVVDEGTDNGGGTGITTADGPALTLVDTNGDAISDVVAVDDTGDGTADFALVDDTGDGLVDVVVVPGETLMIDNSGGLTDPDLAADADVPADDVPFDLDLPGLPGTVLDGAEQADIGTDSDGSTVTDSTVATEDSIAGDPAGSADDWFLQAANGFCVPAALAQVITEMTGEEVTDLGVAAVAEQLGHFEAEGGEDGFSGMTSQGALETLEAMGVPAHIEYAPDADPFSALAAHLEAGRDVVIALDSQELWYDADDDASDGALDDNHVVVVTGVDTANGVIYLNDPGDPEGRAIEVPLSELEEAWEDSDYEMLVTDAAAPDTAADVDTLDVGSDLGLDGDEGILSAGSTGIVYLPLQLARTRL